jgi:copper transport protein
MFAFCVIAALALSGGVAMAHANYVKSNPASDARLARSPSEVRISFSEPPDPRGSDIAVLDATGARKDKADVANATDEGNTIRVSVPALPDGGYLVSWKARSAVDGHETQGAFAFVIGSGPLPAIPDVGPATPPPSPLEIAGRVLSYIGMALVLGSSFFMLFVRAAEQPEERRRERRLVVAGGVLMMLGGALLVVASGSGVPVRLLLFLVLRILAGAVAIAAVSLREGLVPPTARREVTALAALAACLWSTLISHAAASPDPRYVAFDFIHIVAISIWSGGVATFLYAAIPSLREPRVLGATTWRFSLVALCCVATIITTGTLQALDRLVLLEDLFETPYGIALLAKIVLTLALIGLGALNLLLWGPRMRAGGAGRNGLVRGVTVESGLFAGVLIAAGFLTAFPPPNQASGAAFDSTQRVDGLRIELLVASTGPGRNRYVVRVHEGLAAVTSAERVALRFRMVEHDMGEQELVAAQRAPGEYTAEGSPTAMFGTWKVQVIVRLPGRLDSRALFTVPVANTGGQTAQVVPVPPYNLIVFADPSSPQAAAPIALNVVIVDAKGDPVSGKAVRASFTGPGTQSPIDAKEDPNTLGPGRYRVDIPSLDAGTWKIALSVGNEGSGTYTLDIAR